MLCVWTDHKTKNHTVLNQSILYQAVRDFTSKLIIQSLLKVWDYLDKTKRHQSDVMLLR